MFRAGRLIALSVGMLVGCAHPGYRVHLEAKEIDQVGRERFLNRVRSETRSRGFSMLAEERDNAPYFPGMFTSSYVKYLSKEWHDHISLYVHCFSSENRVEVDIENAVRGMEPPVKAEIDAVGDTLGEELKAIVGTEGVSVRRERTRVPWIF